MKSDFALNGWQKNLSETAESCHLLSGPLVQLSKCLVMHESDRNVWRSLSDQYGEEQVTQWEASGTINEEKSV